MFALIVIIYYTEFALCLLQFTRHISFVSDSALKYRKILQDSEIGLVAAELWKPAEPSWLEPWILEIVMNKGYYE